MGNVLVSEASLTDIANEIRQKLGVETTYKPAEMANAIKSISAGGIIPTGTIDIIENGVTDVTNYASANVAVPSLIIPEYSLGGYGNHSPVVVETKGNHFKIMGVESKSGPIINLRDLTIDNLTMPTWFTFNLGAVVKVEYTNVVNSNNLTWNANFKQANTTTSLNFGIGNGTHLDGASITVTQKKDTDIGTLFVYIGSISNGDVLEADVTITVDGVRIL